MKGLVTVTSDNLISRKFHKNFIAYETNVPWWKSLDREFFHATYFAYKSTIRYCLQDRIITGIGRSLADCHPHNANFKFIITVLSTGSEYVNNTTTTGRFHLRYNLRDEWIHAREKGLSSNFLLRLISSLRKMSSP